MSSHHFSTAIPKLTSSRLRLIEETSLLDIHLKIELLEIFNHNRLLTEQRIPDDVDSKTAKTALVAFYKKLGLFTFISDKKSHHTGEMFEFIIVSANEAVHEYMQKFEYDIDDYELGLLYGYHPKSILAFNHLVSRQDGFVHSSPYMYFNSKVFSQDYLKDEDQYHKKIWEELRKISSKIIAEAEAYYVEKVKAGKVK